jgi:hypothetical protein
MNKKEKGWPARAQRTSVRTAEEYYAITLHFGMQRGRAMSCPNKHLEHR